MSRFRVVRLLVAAILVGLLVQQPAAASSNGGATTSASKSTHAKSSSRKKKNTATAGQETTTPRAKLSPSSGTATTNRSSRPRTTSATRDANGRIARSEATKRTFEAQTGYPTGRPGYVVDHIVPLACGGADVPSNMQWQTVAAAKAKDRTERIGCR